MHGNKYTRERAERLVPMLRSIAQEISERARTIEGLEGILEAPDSKSARSPRSQRSAGSAALGADLAIQRRELRLVKQELGRFGCAVDADRPLRILIPGEDGTYGNGYAWNPSDDSLRAMEVELAS